MNSCTSIGNLTKDVAVRQAGTTVVADFTLAVDDPYLKNDEWVKNT